MLFQRVDSTPDAPKTTTFKKPYKDITKVTISVPTDKVEVAKVVACIIPKTTVSPPVTPTSLATLVTLLTTTPPVDCVYEVTTDDVENKDTTPDVVFDGVTATITDNEVTFVFDEPRDVSSVDLQTTDGSSAEVTLTNEDDTSKTEVRKW